MEESPGLLKKGKAGRKKPTRSVSRLWMRAGLMAVSSLLFGSLYFFVRLHFKDGIWRFDLYLFNKSLATASLFLLSFSMLLTGVCYFFPRRKKALAFRKPCGIMGFWLGLIHAVASHALLVHHFPFPAWIGWNPVAAGLGIGALILFAGMAVVSSPGLQKKIGLRTWRRMLRYPGYMALVLAGIHAGILKWASWTRYFRDFASVIPSLSLPVVVVAAAAVLLRLAVWIHHRIH